METDSPDCVLCGAFIHYRSPRKSWATEFRAVRVSCDDEKRRFLTGVGGFLHRDYPFSAPSDPNERYDDPGHRVSQVDEFPPLIGTQLCPEPGYPFHDACWRLLQAYVYPKHVPIDRLYDICHSFPISHKSWLDWGHDYGGLLKTYRDDCHPWEESRIVSIVTPVLGKAAKPSPLSCSKRDPLDIPELQRILDETQGRPKEESSELVCVSERFREHCDRFNHLPVEIRDQILNQLCMNDVVNIRLASRSFASLPLSQLFWRSRFQLNCDRDYVFEVRIPGNTPAIDARQRDWKALFYKTGTISGDGLANRRRIWNTIRSLADLLMTEPLRGSVPHGRTQNNHLSWIGVKGAGNMGSRRMPSRHPPHKLLYEQVVRLPREIRQISFSLVWFSGKQYVCGLRFISNVEPSVDLGYIFPRKGITLDLTNEGSDADPFAGFIAAIGPAGIHALRAKMLSGRLSAWVGCAKGIPQTLRLCAEEKISHMKGGFDGFKLVSLAIPDTGGRDELSPHLPLRETAMWYPEIPSKDLHLHESSFAGKDLPLSEYSPLVQVMFGGPKGAYLKHLTRISAVIANSVIVGLVFDYDPKSSPIRRLQECRSTMGTDVRDRIIFSIDGPGGEILTDMQVKGDYWGGSEGAGWRGAITSIEVKTNRGRSFTFQPSLIPQLKVPPGPRTRKRMKFEITPGTTITGIYVMHDSDFGMVCLGPISEALDTETNGDISSRTSQVTIDEQD